MKRLLVLAGMLLCLAAPMAAQAQVHLNWGGCGPAGTDDNAFACASNTVLHQIVSSFNSPAGVTNFVGATTEVLVSSAGAPLGPWWSLQAGGCRAGSLSSEDPSALLLGDCSTATFDGSTNLGLANYEPNYLGNPAQGRITTDMARSDLGVPLDAGTEYQANVIQIRSTKTTGTGACAGCTDQVSLRTLRVFVGQPSGLQELPGGSGMESCASWRGGNCQPVVPTRRQSWGEVKSLYR
jgi:hypothetical protein